MRYVGAIPTWFLTNLCVLLVLQPDHPWYGRFFGLREWYRGQTHICRYFDFVGWMLVGAVVFLIALSHARA